MYTKASLVYTLLSLAPLAARADLQVDGDDISTTCASVCRPIRELSQTCDVDDDRVNNSDRTEELLELQCICTNDSFDVARLTALCASCMQQNPETDDDGDDDDDDDNDGDDNDLDDINEIISRCGFASVSYSSADSTAADGITVVATKPTAASQLTTTISTGVGATATSSGATSRDAAAKGSASTTGTSSSSTSTSTSTNSASGADSTGTSSSGSTTTTSAASGMAPLAGSWSVVAAVGGALVGFWAL